MNLAKGLYYARLESVHANVAMTRLKLHILDFLIYIISYYQVAFDNATLHFNTIKWQIMRSYFCYTVATFDVFYSCLI